MSNSSSSVDQDRLVECLLQIEAQYVADPLAINEAYPRLYTLHRQPAGTFTANAMPVMVQAERGTPTFVVLVGLAAVLKEALLGPALAGFMPSAVVGVAVCGLALEVTDEDSVDERREEDNAEQRLSRLAYGRLLDGTEAAVHRPRGGLCVALSGYRAMDDMRQGVGMLIEAIVAGQAAGGSMQ